MVVSFLSFQLPPAPDWNKASAFAGTFEFCGETATGLRLISSFESTLQADEKVDGVADPRKAHNSGASYRLAWKAIVAQYSMCGTEYMIQCTMMIREDADG